MVSLKNDRPRRIMPAPWVMDILKNRRLMQEEHKAQAGEAWSNPMHLVFTNEVGRNLIPQTVYRLRNFTLTVFSSMNKLYKVVMRTKSWKGRYYE